ncbi:MAG: Uma2 family endonuclease, partial [Acidobacteriota bacterium]|nr:Uma2 family endonuclease [Acidobacteriota bacterium]
LAKLNAMSAILKLKKQAEIYYPESDGKPIGETDYHIQTITYLYQTLSAFFSSETDIKVLADIMFYYEEGNPRKVFSPDVMIVKGVGNHPRRTYKLWEEKQFPQVIFEISSRKTWGDDLNKKWFLYQQLGAKEYYIFDPEYDYLPEPLIAYRLKRGELKQVAIKNNRIYSEEIGLEIVDTGEGLRLFNRETNQFMRTLSESENEVARLREEVERLCNAQK